MEQIAVRELRNHTAGVLGRIKAGESLEITEYGRPVARIIPLGLSRWDELKARGEIEPAEEQGDPLDLPTLPAVPGKPSLSQILAEMRASERF
ncbi:MAG: type II toxin-antitoxin system Phd/YefM family antitoxin [Candidatus Dormibacteraceae bacterium]